MDEAVAKHLGNAVRIHDRAAFADALADLKGKTIVADPERAVAAIFEALNAGGAQILSLRDPAVLAKHPKVLERVQRTVDAKNSELPRSKDVL